MTEPKLVELASGRVFPLGPATTIGRDPENAVCLTDMMVGRRHAEVHRLDDGRFELCDLGSRHGTYVGGRRVAKVVLEGGDEILIGGSRLRFEKGGTALTGQSTGGTVRVDTGIGGMVQRRLSVWDAGKFAPASQIGAPEDLARDYEKLRAALEVSRTIGVEHDLTTLLERLLTTAFDLLPAERGAVLLLDGATGGAVAEISRSRSGELEPLRLPSSLIDEVLQQQAGVLTANAEFDDRFSRSSSIIAQGIRSAMCVPMLYRGLADSASVNQHEILGIMYLDSRLAAGAFSARDLDLFTSIANQAALALKNAVLVQHIRAVKAAEGKRLEQVVRNLPSGVILLDSERRISLVNPQVEELLELLGGARPGDVLEHLGPLSVADILAADRGELEITVTGPPRRILAVSAAGFASGVEQGAVLTLRDVTDEREREMKAAHEERLTLLGRLAGGIAHDFNNLLTVIISSTDFALSATTQDPQLTSDLEMIRDAAERAAALTRQLLAFGRRELIKPKVVDINSLVSQLQDLLKRTLGSDIEIHSRFTHPLPAVKIDPAQFERVLANLVVNARDAMPNGGLVTIETDVLVLDEVQAERYQVLRPGPHVCLTVRDTGVGMPPEILERIFEPFFTTKEKGKGTGLGLATVYGVARQAGGAVTVDSVLGRGSVFRVFLPASTEALALPVRRVTMMVPTMGATILLAEDLAPVLSLTERMLQRCGYHVLTARDGEEGLAVAQKHPGTIDLLLTDIIMPKMSGWVLAEKLRAQRPGLRVMFVSGQVDDAVDSNVIGGEATAFLPKPYTPDELLEQVRLLLEAPARRQSTQS
ncbi:MAG TPA: ATP-binding protein [Kofleriaceae bacterium]|nr:ATP-binding protein [Kofleriaceae bacterium]